VRGKMMIAGMIAPMPRTPSTQPAGCEIDATQ
jgi:hypothetical protein